jgi:hypothetical protein
MNTRVGKVYDTEVTISSYGVCEQCKVMFEKMHASAGENHRDNFNLMFNRV